jgi:hypothetical protein
MYFYRVVGFGWRTGGVCRVKVYRANVYCDVVNTLYLVDNNYS